MNNILDLECSNFKMSSRIENLMEIFSRFVSFVIPCRFLHDRFMNKIVHI